MRSIIISILIIMVSAITCFSGEKGATPENLVKATTGQILAPGILQTQRYVQHCEKVMTEYKHGKWGLNDRDFQMVLMNLSALYSEAGEYRKEAIPSASSFKFYWADSDGKNLKQVYP